MPRSPLRRLPVAHMAVVCSDAQSRRLEPELPARRPLEDRRHVVDPSRKVAWEWWNDWNLAGVDFRTGVNNATYKYYIDFAAANGIEYVYFDEGWAANPQADLDAGRAEIDLRESVEYGAGTQRRDHPPSGRYYADRDMGAPAATTPRMGWASSGLQGRLHGPRDDQQMTALTTAPPPPPRIPAADRLPWNLQARRPEPHAQRPQLRGRTRAEQLKWRPASHDQVKYDTQLPSSARWPDRWTTPRER